MSKDNHEQQAKGYIELSRMLGQVIQELNKNIVKYIPYSFDFVHLIEQDIVIDLYLSARFVVRQTTIDKKEYHALRVRACRVWARVRRRIRGYINEMGRKEPQVERIRKEIKKRKIGNANRT